MFFVPRTTGSTHGQRDAPNLLRPAQPADPDPAQPGVGEQHHRPATGQRRVGLLVHLSERLHQARGGSCPVGLAGAGRLPGALVISALQRALLAQRPAPGLVIHSDWGRTR